MMGRNGAMGVREIFWNYYHHSSALCLASRGLLVLAHS